MSDLTAGDYIGAAVGLILLVSLYRKTPIWGCLAAGLMFWFIIAIYFWLGSKGLDPLGLIKYVVIVSVLGGLILEIADKVSNKKDKQ